MFVTIRRAALGVALILLAAVSSGCASLPGSFDRSEIAVPSLAARQTVGPVVWEWQNFCAREPRECQTVQGHAVVPFEVAVRVNANVNARVRFVEDRLKYRLIDYWTTVKDGEGDCEDFALTKRQQLRAMGYSSESMRMVVLSNSRGEDLHAVLLVRTEKGDVALDNNFPDPLLIGDTGKQVQVIESQGEWYPLSHLVVRRGEASAIVTSAAGPRRM